MALSLAGESVPGDGGDSFGISPAGLASYYPSFLPPAHYFETAPDFFQPLKPLGELVSSPPPLPPFTFSRVPAFQSQPPPLPPDPFPSLPLPVYTRLPAPFPPSEGSALGTRAPGSLSPPYPSPPRRAARSPGADGAAGQSCRYHFTEEELNAVLYGALRSSQPTVNLHAISGLRVSPASSGKGVFDGGERGTGWPWAAGRSLQPGVREGSGTVPKVCRQPGSRGIAGGTSDLFSLRFSCVTSPHLEKAGGRFGLRPLSGRYDPLLQGRCRTEEGVLPLQALRTRPPRCSTGTRCSSPKVGRCPGAPAPACPPGSRSAPCPPQGSRCCGWPTGTCLSSESSVRTPSRKESASALSKAKWSTRARSRLTTTTRWCGR